MCHPVQFRAAPKLILLKCEENFAFDTTSGNCFPKIKSEFFTAYEKYSLSKASNVL